MMNVVGHGAKTDAYKYEKVQSFKRLGYTVECMTAYNDILLVAVKGDQLLQYNVKFVFDASKNKQKIRLEGPHTRKVFGKPVSDMQAIPEHFNLLLSVHDNMLNFYDLNHFFHKTSIPGSKGFNQYAVSVQVYEWDGTAFVAIISGLSLFEPVSKMIWCSTYLMVGLKDQYLLLNPNNGEFKELCNFGASQKEPLMLRLDVESKKRVILEHDNTSMVWRDDGKPYGSYCITWTGVPSHIVFESPYLMAVLPRYVEVRTFKPSVSIQQIEIRHVIHICSGKNVVFIHSKDGLYMLTLRKLTSRIKYMVKSRNYDVAIQLQEQQTDITTEERTNRITTIQGQQAVYLFTIKKFKEAMNTFAALQTDPSHVIGMLPDLLPSTLSNSLEYPEKIPTLQGKELTKALSELVEYLHKKKAEIMKEKVFKPFSPVMVSKRRNTLQSREQVMSVIDTTLVKCYIQIDITRVRDMLMSPDNSVHYEEAEKALKHAGNYQELILLYKQHKHFDKALLVLKEQAAKTKSLQPTIELLHELGDEYIELIFEHSKWVLDEDPYEGLKIFTADLPLVQGLPRERIASFLEKTCPLVIVEYLEHLIYQWKDETEELHAMLADQLRLQVEKEYTTQELVQFKDVSVKAGTEDGMLGIARLKFIKFLKATSVYDPAYIWSKLPLDSFYEERAIVLGLMGKHEQALGVYVYVLEDLAEVDDDYIADQVPSKQTGVFVLFLEYFLEHFRYCDMMYSKGVHDIYLSLLKVYLEPPKPLALGITNYQRQPKTRAMQALLLIESQATKIDMLKAIEILPDDMMVKNARAVLELALNESVTRLYLTEVQRHVQYQDMLQISEQNYKECCKQKITITDSVECNVCKRKIGKKSIFVRISNGDLVHYGCYNNAEKASG